MGNGTSPPVALLGHGRVAEPVSPCCVAAFCLRVRDQRFEASALVIHHCMQRHLGSSPFRSVVAQYGTPSKEQGDINMVRAPPCMPTPPGWLESHTSSSPLRLLAC
eukprot:93629-Pleurochrysis_carterae.AAC.1